MYASRYNLNRHVTYSHPGFNQYRCQTCLKVLSSKQNYKQHLMLHTGELPFKCDMCSEGFRQTGQLAAHRKSHLEKARKVQVCKVRNRQLTEMMRFSEDWDFNPTVQKTWSVSSVSATPPSLVNLRKELLMTEVTSSPSVLSAQW